MPVDLSRPTTLCDSPCVRAFSNTGAAIPRLILVAMWLTSDDRLALSFGSALAAAAWATLFPATSVAWCLSYTYAGRTSAALIAIALGLAVDLSTWAILLGRYIDNRRVVANPEIEW